MLAELIMSIELMVQQTKANMHFLITLIALLWGIFFLNACLKHRLFFLGIVPRKIFHLSGIFFSPFLHANTNHLFFNCIPLVVLSNFLLLQGLQYYEIATFLIISISGFLLWCFGKPGLHIGASGVITGYWGLLVTDMYEQGTVTAIILGVISLYYFAGIFLGIFPGKKGVSWEGHLFGLVAGIVVSFML